MGQPASLTRRSLLASVLAQSSERVIDFHQHTHYHGRDNAGLIAHQKNLGAQLTVLLPAGSQFGLEADVWGNDSALELARQHPDRFVFFANELPNVLDTKDVLEKYLKAGAKGIGEQKYFVDCDSSWMRRIADIAQDHQVPVLMHFQYGKYNEGFQGFYRMLERYPRVNFVAHAQTWWANIDAGQQNRPEVLYPKGPIQPGGLSDKWLSDYPNLYGDLSAGSGLNALQRDEAFSADFLKRHQNKLIYGSDCQDIDTVDPRCCGSRQMALVRRLLPDAAAQRRIFYENAAKLLRIK